MARHEKLSRAGIVKAAMEMIDAHGEKGFSMRKLATELSVDPMAIYHHHANKSALIHEVMQALMEECEVPEASGKWDKDLYDLCIGLRKLAQKHPGTFRIYETYERWVQAEHRLHEAFYTTLLEAGFSPKMTVQAVRALLTYTEAFAVDEITGWLEPENRKRLSESLAHGSYTTTITLIDEIGAPDTDADFTFGLDVLLCGLREQLHTQ